MDHAAKLASADPAVRAAAALELAGAKASDQLGLLTERLPAESDPDVLVALLKAVGHLGTPRELSLLAQFIDHAEARVRGAVIEALCALNTPVALPLIVPFLSDPDQRVRQAAGMVLRKVGPERALKVLQQMLGSPHVWMRCSAATALGLFDAAVAVPLLERALKDPNPKVQERAAMALRRYSRKTLRHVTKAISKEAVRNVLKATSQPNMRRLTRKVSALDAPAKPAVADLAAAASNPPAPPAPPARASKREEGMSRVERVIEERDASALGRLVEDLSNDEDRFVTARVLTAIGILEEQSLAPVLVSHLAHPDARVASNAVAALTRLGDRSAREQIRPLLRSMQPRLRANAILYCARDEGEDVRAPLEEMIRSADVQTRLSGLFCIAELGREDVMPLAELIEWRPEDAALRATVRARLDEMSQRGIAGAGRVKRTLDASSSRTSLAPARSQHGKSQPEARSQPEMKTPRMDPAAVPAPDGRGIADTDGTAGTLVPISRRRWRTFLLVARAMATATDMAVVGVPIACGLLVLEAAAGGLPGVVAPIGLLAALGLFLARDLPGGPGVGKRLLGLAVVAPPKAPLSAHVMRQLPVVLVPWGLAELYQASQDGRGQRPTDVKLGLEVVPRGAPLLAHFACVWLVLAAIVAASYVFVTSRPIAPDGLLWSLKTGFRPRPADGDGPAIPRGSGDDGTATSPTGPAADVAGSFAHPTLGLTIPVPRGWAVHACGSAFLELRPRAGTNVTTGALVVMMPSEADDNPSPEGWGEEMARRFNAQLERERLRLAFWAPAQGRSALGGTTGPLYSGDLMGGQEAVLFSSGRMARPVGVSCRLAGERGLARRLVDAVVRGCQGGAGGDWRRYRSPFRKLALKVPAGWAVHREDREALTLRPGVDPDSAWIRLEHADAKRRGPSRARVEAVHMPRWRRTGFDVGRVTAFSLPGLTADGLAVDLRSRSYARARFRIAWIDHPAPGWTEEWLERDALSFPRPLEDVLGGLTGT